MAKASLPNSNSKNKVCSVAGCALAARSKGYCSLHYARFKRTGDPLKVRYLLGTGNTPEARFWSRVDRSGTCWLWKGSTANDGYGSVTWNGRLYRCSHVAIFLTHGQWPARFVLHKCDNPPCVNPEHLYEGGHVENSQDKVSRGRQSRGEKHGNSKLTEMQVVEIKKLIAARATQTEIARRFGVDQSAISLIATGKMWQHVK